MAMEQGLYAQVVKLRRNYLKFIAANKNKNEAKLKFHGPSARSQRWFDLDFDWIKVSFSTREPDFSKNLFQRHDKTQDTSNTFKGNTSPDRGGVRLRGSQRGGSQVRRFQQRRVRPGYPRRPVNWQAGEQRSREHIDQAQGRSVRYNRATRDILGETVNDGSGKL